MANTPLSYTQIKASMADSGFPVSSGAGWTAKDDQNFVQFASGVAYGKQAFSKTKLHYGLAYASEMPSSVAAEVGADNYSATLAGTPLSGAHPLAVALTVTESGSTGTSFLWDFGDGNTQTTTVKTVNHTYAAAGSFTPKVTPTVGGKAKPQVSAAAPVVVS